MLDEDESKLEYDTFQLKPKDPVSVAEFKYVELQVIKVEDYIANYQQIVNN
ncbi:MAG: hypothetical protein ACXWAT_00555 [Methylobacter sp.]